MAKNTSDLDRIMKELEDEIGGPISLTDFSRAQRCDMLSREMRKLAKEFPDLSEVLA